MLTIPLMLSSPFYFFSWLRLIAEVAISKQAKAKIVLVISTNNYQNIIRLLIKIKIYLF